MPELQSVNDYIIAARDLLQDNDAGAFRYSNEDIVFALNMAILEVVRIRPDMYMRELRSSAWVPSYSESTPGLAVLVNLNDRFRNAVLMFIVGYVQLRDDEATQDARAGAFIDQFSTYLTTASGHRAR